MRLTRFLLACGIGLTTTIIAMAARPAAAQRLLDEYLAADLPGIGAEPGVTVRSRLRPEYDAQGIKFGNITIRPDLFETVGFDDNVLGRPNRNSSALIETNGRLRADYDSSNTTGFASLSVDDNRFPEQHQQSYTNWTAALGLTHQFGRDTLSVAYEHLNLNQTVRDLDTPQLDKALPYQVDTVRAAYRAVLNRLFIEPRLAVTNYSLTDGSVAGVPYIQTDRDRVIVEPGVTLGYELAPRRNVIVAVREAVASYRNRLPGAASRDFNDVSVLAGLDFQEGIFRYRLLAGYEIRTFTSAQVPTIANPIAEATVIWSPTSLTTVTGQLTRHIQDSADETTVAFTETAINLRVDHELQHNVLLYGVAQHLQDTYSQGQGSQNLITIGTGATWLLDRGLSLTASYEFDRRNSNGAARLGSTSAQFQGTSIGFGASYSENRAMLTLHFAL